MQSKQKLSVLITTMNDGIYRVKKDLLDQLSEVDEVIISHQITEENIKPESDNLGKNVKYFFMFEKGLSKNRNNALHNSTGDICYICDDDLEILPGFDKIIKQKYDEINADIITFQAVNPIGTKHFRVNEGSHNHMSVLKVWSWGITFKRKVIIDKNISFDEGYGLGSPYPVGEENIFLMDCYRQGLSICHSDVPIVIHPDESSGIEYRDDLIIARIKVFKRLFGFIGGVMGVFYFTIFHYKFYKDKYTMKDFISISVKSLLSNE